ncbi:hypothetical protein AAG906_022847 [Vitis piasezkii]
MHTIKQWRDDEQPPLPPPKREMNSPFSRQETDQATSSLPLATHYHRPQPPYTQSDWNTVNAMLVSWITNTIDPEVKSTLSKFRDAKRLWEHLKQRYAMVNGPRIQQLKTSIAKCEQPKSMSVTTYYGKLNVLWEELFKHEPLISCTCCSSCTAASLHQARREQGKLHDFLMGLNTDLYAQLRTNILSQDPLPSLDRAGRGKTERPMCSHYKKTGHETSTCWSLVACPHCHKHGHDKNNCYEIVGYPEGWLDQNKADGVLGVLVLTPSSTVGASSTTSSTDQLFTPNNGKLFLTRSHGSLTRATHHVTGDLSWLFDTIALFECPVGLPNGESCCDPIRFPRWTLLLGGAEGDSIQHVYIQRSIPLSCGTKGWDILEKVVKLLPPLSNLKGCFPFGNPVFVNIIRITLFGLEGGVAAHTEAYSATLSLAEVVPTVGLDSLGLDNTSNGRSAPMGKE